MKRKRPNRYVLIAAFICGLFSISKAASSKPNILWIVANDMSTDLGCYGNRQVSTQNLDQLAREGVIFKNFRLGIDDQWPIPESETNINPKLGQ